MIESSDASTSSTKGWPDRRRMIPGISAYGWMVTGILIVMLSIILGTFYIGLLIASAGNPISGDETIRSVVLLTSGLGVGGVLTAFSIRTSSEIEQGYTTNPLRHPQVDLCDWRTGAILRKADAPLLTWAQFRKVRALSRLRMRQQ